ncbi:hypothetical protein FS749_014886 [Ceratobasidium sp. UAMH 11750]|nr:hypothetical protein FS749_014886 [Ceratobasidium sp. UAMH 11750]
MIGGCFLSPETLVSISLLPRLNELDIDQISSHNKNLPGTFRAAQLSEESFPELQLLRLYSSTHVDFLAAWDVAPLVFTLTAIHLSYVPNERTNPASIYEEGVLGPLLPHIAAHSPYLKQITLESAPMNRPLSANPTTLSWAHFARLPITHLKLQNLQAEGEFLKTVHRFWPDLVVLDMPNQQLTLDNLVYLRNRLRRLKLLRAGFKDFIDPVPDILPHTTSPLRVIEMSNPLTKRFRIKSAESVARFLLSQWPNLQQISYKNEFQDDPQSDLELLNLYIRIIRGVAQSKKNISSRYGPGAVGSLLDQRLCL